VSQIERVKRGLARRVQRRLAPDFYKDIHNKEVSLTLDLESDAPTWLLLFGGRAGGMGLPPFEFFKVTKGIPTKRLFVRDLEQAWYHQGIAEAGTSIAETATYLKGVIDGQEHDRLVVTGISAGGYAALVFGSLLGADTVLAFSPQTVLDPDLLLAMDDDRWDKPLRELMAAGKLDPAWLDLKEALPCARAPETRCEVHFDRTLDADRLHAERIAGPQGIELFPREGGGHNIPGALRASGELETVLCRALGVTR
jgi:hypothetical protein